MTPLRQRMLEDLRFVITRPSPSGFTFIDRPAASSPEGNRYDASDHRPPLSRRRARRSRTPAVDDI